MIGANTRSILFVACTLALVSTTTEGQTTSCQHTGAPSPNDVLSEPIRVALFAAREAVWRAYFTGDSAALVRLLPDTMTAMPRTRAEIIEDARSVVATGTKFVGIEFSDDRMFLLGEVAIMWSRYTVRLTNGAGAAQREEGCPIELFVRRGDGWINPYWHLDPR